MEPNKRGYLYKRAAGGLKKWNKRFFELSGNNYLVYYSDEHRKDPKMIDLSQAKAIVPSTIIINGDTLDTQLCFEIQSPHETHYLNAPNRKEYDSWLATLNEIRAKAHPRNSTGDITNSHLLSTTTNPAFNNVTPYSTNTANPSYPALDKLQQNHAPNTSANNMNYDTPMNQLSPISRPQRPAPYLGASVTIVAFEPPGPLEFPDLSLSFTTFDCTWEKQLLAAIENEKITRETQLREREARLQAGQNPRPQTPPALALENSSSQIIRPATPMEVTPTRPTTPVVHTSPPTTPQPSFKDELFLELVNEHFNPELLKRAFQLFPINDKAKLKNTARIFAGLVAAGTPEDFFMDVYHDKKEGKRKRKDKEI